MDPLSSLEVFTPAIAETIDDGKQGNLELIAYLAV